jgi:transposase
VTDPRSASAAPAPAAPAAEGAQPSLFPTEPQDPPAPSCPIDPERGARLLRADRTQIAWGRIDLDAALPEDHPARAIVAVLDRLDLRALYSEVKARGKTAGTAAIDPKILLALWIYATSDGVGSGREIARLTQLHAAYRWICGGVEVAYHRLNDFRSDHGDVFDQLVTQVLARLLAHDLVDLSRVAQDGTRVRASAGAASFRRGRTLDELMTEARAHLVTVTRDAQDPAISARQAAAMKRAAKERIARLEAALAELPAVIAVKKKNGSKGAEPRVSTTDSQARIMKMADGGFRPAYNVQLATTTDGARVIVGVDVTQRGSDQGQTTPMIAQIEARSGVRPTEILVDGGYTGHDAIDEAAARGTTVYGPLPKPRAEGVDPHAPKAGDSAAVGQWRARMATDDAKAIYKQRAATAETVNADGKAHRGLASTSLRGLEKVKGGALLFALTYDILRLIALSA